MKMSTLLLLVLALAAGAPTLRAEQSGPRVGTVAETMQSGGYTYIRLKEPDLWIATGPLEVSAGDAVQYTGGMEMRDFHSNSLDRTFESIWFMEHVSALGSNPGQPQQGAATGQGAELPMVPQSASVAAPAAGEIERLEGGRNIAEVHAERAALDGQQVSLRARVIKVSEYIMGKNWVTLQDGSGTAPDDKLIASTTELVAVGATVVAKGTVRSDVDIGSGYQYEVLLEDTSFE